MKNDFCEVIDNEIVMKREPTEKENHLKLSFVPTEEWVIANPTNDPIFYGSILDGVTRYPLPDDVTVDQIISIELID